MLAQRIKHVEKGPISTKFRRDAMMLLEFNCCMTACEDIPLEAFFEGRVFLGTANCNMVRLMLKTPKNRETFEQVVDLCGLEHLGNVRFMEAATGNYVDLYVHDDSGYVVTGKNEDFVK